ncbi:MAG: hypothetical protein L0Z51_11330, partial [Candidatus Latescibacteria bacterium]|nr:hypothetical protein [Candidatus Latescibacterota bacterium]
DTLPTPSLSHAIQFLGNPRLHGRSEEALHVLLARPYHPEVNPYLAFWILYPRGKLRAALDSMNDPDTPPARRARFYHRFHLAGVSLPPEELERILALGAPDTTDPLFRPTFLLVGAYAVDRGQWDEYAAALDWERARVQRLLASAPDWAHENEGAALAMEGYALWKRGQKEEAIRALEAAQQLTWGWESQRFAPWFNYDVTVRWWLGELMLEVGRPRDRMEAHAGSARALAGDGDILLEPVRHGDVQRLPTAVLLREGAAAGRRDQHLHDRRHCVS